LISPILRRFAIFFFDLDREEICEYDATLRIRLRFLLPVTEDAVFLDVEEGSGNNSALAREE
jgi:hypothetical protein